MHFEFDAFISFAWKDLARAGKLHERLKERGYVTRYARKELRAGQVLVERIFGDMAMSRFIFVIHSRHHAGGRWASKELTAA